MCQLAALSCDHRKVTVSCQPSPRCMLLINESVKGALKRWAGLITFQSDFFISSIKSTPRGHVAWRQQIYTHIQEGKKPHSRPETITEISGIKCGLFIPNDKGKLYGCFSQCFKIYSHRSLGSLSSGLLDLHQQPAGLLVGLDGATLSASWGLQFVHGEPATLTPPLSPHISIPPTFPPFNCFSRCGGSRLIQVQL